MSATGAPPTPEDSSYIRAGGGVPVNTRRVAGVLVWLAVAALLGTAAYLAASTAGRDSRLARLRDHGVAVQATVTSCTAISSGVGMGIEYWDCRATYDLGGGRFSAALGGNRKLIDAGTGVAAVAVPGDPGLLYTAASVRASNGSGTGYVAAAVVGAAAVLLGAGRLVAARGRRQAGR